MLIYQKSGGIRKNHHLGERHHEIQTSDTWTLEANSLKHTWKLMGMEDDPFFCIWAYFQVVNCEFLAGCFSGPKNGSINFHSCGFHANKQIQCRYILRPSSSVNIAERQSHSGFLWPSWWVRWAPFCNDSKNKKCWFPRDVRWYSYICSFVCSRYDTPPKEPTWNLEITFGGNESPIFQKPLICWVPCSFFSGGVFIETSRRHKFHGSMAKDTSAFICLQGRESQGRGGGRIWQHLMLHTTIRWSYKCQINA